MARHLITSALPYINGDKHLGNLVGSMLPADVYARFLRQTGREVLFICATDEHGTPAELAALEAGLPVDEYCRGQHEFQRSVYQAYELSFDHFGRSSSPQNHELTKHFARKLDENGFLEERETDQVYSHGDGRFLPDRYIIGTCPYCGYTAARGDQCESCSRLLDPVDLLEPRSAISGSTDLEVRRSRHLFLLQSKLAPEIRRWIDAQTDWPVLATSIARSWLDEGLEDRSITRDLSWGVPVDRPGFEGKVFYVWFDAPIAYVGATNEWGDVDAEGRDWRGWWTGEDVHYSQFMAKDNVPFHTVTFPATILGSREPWRLPTYVKAFNWLTYYGGKFSTSRQYGVFMSDAISVLPADYWRYFLIAQAPESRDTPFTWESFAAAVNSDLVGNFGNFVNRVLSLVRRDFDSAVPAGGARGEREDALVADLREHLGAYHDALERFEFRKGAAALRSLWTVGNAYLTHAAPWHSLERDRDDAAQVLRTATNLVRLFAVAASPIVPAAARTTLEALGVPGDAPRIPSADDLPASLETLGPGHRVEVPDVLFRRIAAEDVAGWRERFGGPIDDEGASEAAG